jgi:ABC-2 type transport system ATP-binding protein
MIRVAEDTGIVAMSRIRMLFGDVPALEIDSLKIESGTSTVLVGPNGAGKSTLLLIVAGLLRPVQGRVTIGGAEPGSAAALAAVSFTPDQPALFDDLTVDDQLAYIARLHKVDLSTTRSQRLIEDLDASELLNKFPRSMSKGQRQKAGLVVATARPFDVLLLDEPTTALDSDSRTALVAAIGSFVAEGVTVISSTHDAELIDAADAEVHLVKGRLASMDSQDEEE